MSDPILAPALPPLLQGALTPEPTADGSFTLFSEDFGEWFHSREGAYTEAYTTYVEATDLTQLAQADALRILDVCYGLGYNTAAALATVRQVNPQCRVHLMGLELDGRVPKQAVDAGLVDRWLPEIQAMLAQLAEVGQVNAPPLQAELRLGDARQTIQTLAEGGFQADVIFFDPFSPPHCPELWTVDFMGQVARCLAPQGKLATYSCAAAVRAAFLEVGLHLGPIAAAGRRWPGTLVRWSPDGLDALSQQEQEHLQTRAAVPYRDPSLQDSADAIRQRRQQEQAQSGLAPTSQWRKRWL
ncbi:tRNA (5-methylaminomethyl-2-thiouridine)(34)-methyltransferase MnmD [Leptolyngbya sp. BL0902]|uniref:tRNA (5-methylaminomethyl-2-thiouridine)(34)-methyltransferase MnmD n=1 Tax=Leptolyngbya sp. BL0902 TaxID=1115757 RepID=UPI0018E767E2|nr:MnmC family methyltransferase [Leptolyngbya sp. BL0902]